MNKKLPYRCPSCENHLKVKSLLCDQCGTEVSGLFFMPLLSRLRSEDQDFIIDFIKCSGNLKIMAQNLKLSYPTVRNLLDDIITRIDSIEKQQIEEK